MNALVTNHKKGNIYMRISALVNLVVAVLCSKGNVFSSYFTEKQI